jgi:hypothetical protein
LKDAGKDFEIDSEILMMMNSMFSAAVLFSELFQKRYKKYHPFLL